MLELSLAQKIIIWAPPVLLAITCHEVAHGWVASWYGDQTARLLGRLTLNPIKHIDPIGTILVPLVLLLTGTGFLFGWAKPVPVDARNLNNPRRDLILVALAGPTSNLCMALLWALILKIGLMSMPSATSLALPMILMAKAGVMINIFLAVLNCLPVPQLDGGQVLSNLLPPRYGMIYRRLEPYSILILLGLMFSNALLYLVALPSEIIIQGIFNLFGIS